jgi:hypothetical protein
MALQIRRGTDAERLAITPAVGELIYTTDTKLLYVGDGTTVGGTKADTGITDLAEDTTPQLGGTLDLNSNNITGVGNISNSGNITATGVVSAASGNFTAATIGLATGNFKGTFAADDSVILIDGVSGKVNLAPNAIGDLGNVHNSVPADGDALVWNNSLSRWEAGAPANAGDVVGSVFSDDSTLKIDGITGISYGPFIGELNGSVFGDDSTLLVDGISNSVNGEIITVNGAGSISNTQTGDFFYDVNTEDGKSSLRFKRASDSDLSASNVSYGSILMGRDGSDGTVMTTNIATSFAGLFISNDSTGAHTNANTYMSIVDGDIGIGTYTPTDKLSVVGNASISGTVEAGSFKGSYALDDSTTIIDGINGTITAVGFVQFGSYTTAERDALTAANGMVVYNTSLNVFQGYQNSAWVTFTTS